MEIKDYIYSLLVNKHPEITRNYHRFRKNVNGYGRVSAWIYLLKLNVQYILFKGVGTEDFYEAHKKLQVGISESLIDSKKKPEDLAEELASYDVISFDVFDTLIFRPFSNPTDLFFLVGEKLEYPDFERIRVEIEKKAREKKLLEKENSEVTFDDIWSLMELETGIPKEEGKKCEWECELKYCFANPYMKKVLKVLHEKGKHVIAVSDMYLGKEYLRELLHECGMRFIDKIYVSCDCGKSKSNSVLFQELKNIYGHDRTYVHVGDNEISDYKHAKENGFTAILYKNVNELGNKYRADDMSAITGSIYCGLINSYIYNGIKKFSLPYEFGFIYGGLFVLGYCQWIHKYVETNKCDKILFLARDGDILSQVYKILYPRDAYRVEYVYWSRLAATKMTAQHFKYDYFRRFLYHKVNQGYTLKKIFASMELEDMLETFLIRSENRENYTGQTVLTSCIADEVKRYLTDNWNLVLEHYDEQREAGKDYYMSILNGCRHAVAVDVGWAGSGAICLDYLVNKEWNLNCEIVGLIAGSNSLNNHEPNTSEPFFRKGKLVSYMFSQEKNRDIWKSHNPNNGDNIVVELLLASKEKSFRGFSKENFIFSDSKPEINAEEVQQGIIDFVEWYLERIGDIPEISGRDAYAPIKVVTENREWMKRVANVEKAQMNLE